MFISTTYSDVYKTVPKVQMYLLSHFYFKLDKTILGKVSHFKNKRFVQFSETVK